MRIAVLAGDSSEPLVAGGVLCHDVRDPLVASAVLARKGNLVSGQQVRELLERGVGEVHLAVPDAGDVGEDVAARQIGEAVAGAGVTVGEPRFGQANLVSTTRGFFGVDADRLDDVNDHDGVLVLTGEADRPVDAGTTLGVVKSAPLFLPEQTLHRVAAVGTAVEVKAFRPHRVAFVAPRDRLRGGAFDRASASLATALEWYGSALDCLLPAETSCERLADAYRSAVEARVDIVFAAGAAGTDPLDMVFEGLRAAGGEVTQIGIPAEPGTACWIGRIADRPVLGLASCELFGQPGALDLLLPRMLSGQELDRTLVRRLALGGLLQGPGRTAPYH